MTRVISSCVVLAAIAFFAEPAAAQTAQQMVTLAVDAPVFASPIDNQVPLRVGKQGSILRLLDATPDWARVEFEDPQFGRRVGYVQRKYVQMSAPVPPMNVSVPQAEASPSVAQRPPVTDPASPRAARPTTSSRGFFEALAGFTFGGSETAPAAGVLLGGSVTPNVQLFGQGAYLRNILPSGTNDALKLLGIIAAGVPFGARASAFTATGGTRVIIPAGVVRPYVTASGGAAFINISAQAVGVSVDSASSTKGIVEVGGGILVPIGSASFDAGYTYRTLINTDATFNISALHAGVGVRF
jgi:hypothetical protein